MLDPMTIAALIGAGVQAAGGISQLIGGASKEAPQTPYNIPQEYKDILAQAQARTTQGLPAQSLKYYQDMAQRASATALRNMSARNLGAAGLAGVAQAEMDSGRQIAMQDAERRIQSELQNRQELLNAQQLMGQAKDKAFDITRQREDLAAQQKGALIGAGLQNIMGGVQSGLGTFAQGQYIKTLKDKNIIDQKALDAALAAKKTAAPMGPEVPSDFTQTPYQTGSYSAMGPNLPGVNAPTETDIQPGIGSVMPSLSTGFPPKSAEIKYVPGLGLSTSASVPITGSTPNMPVQQAPAAIGGLGTQMFYNPNMPVAQQQVNPNAGQFQFGPFNYGLRNYYPGVGGTYWTQQ